MFEPIEQYFQQIIPSLTKDELALIVSKGVVKKLRKRQLLLHEGEVCRCKTFILKGLLRNYSIQPDGHEIVMRFADAHSWTTDVESYNSQQPSKYNIDALEPAEVVMWSKEDFDQLRSIIPALGAYSEHMMNQSMSFIQNRLLMNISANAEARYLDFINSFPNIFNRVPLHMIASYLGVSRETLTRIRQGLAVAK